MTDNFVWYELCSNDLDGAKAFYGKLFGWTATRFEGEARAITISWKWPAKAWAD